jgi:hypothetical protein
MEVGQEEMGDDETDNISESGTIPKFERGNPKGRIFRENREIYNIVIF